MPRLVESDGMSRTADEPTTCRLKSLSVPGSLRARAACLRATGGPKGYASTKKHRIEMDLRMLAYWILEAAGTFVCMAGFIWIGAAFMYSNAVPALGPAVAFVTPPGPPPYEVSLRFPATVEGSFTPDVSVGIDVGIAGTPA